MSSANAKANGWCPCVCQKFLVLQSWVERQNHMRRIEGEGVGRWGEGGDLIVHRIVCVPALQSIPTLQLPSLFWDVA